MAFGDNTTVFPVRAQIFHFTVFIFNSTTGNALTGALADLAIEISKDGAAFAAAAGTVTAVSGTPGCFQIVLTAADMTANVIAYRVTTSTANAMYAYGEIRTADLTESTTRAMDQSVVKLEQILRQGWAFHFNQHEVVRATGVYNVYNDATGAVLYTGTVSDTGGALGTGIRGKLS